jgi:hypothetical protein
MSGGLSGAARHKLKQRSFALVAGKMQEAQQLVCCKLPEGLSLPQSCYVYEEEFLDQADSDSEEEGKGGIKPKQEPAVPHRGAKHGTSLWPYPVVCDTSPYMPP